TLYFVIDISSPSPLAPDIAYNLIDIVKEEYYRDLSDSPEKSFENALKAANEEFAAIAKEGEKSWLGKTNISIGTIFNNKLLAVQRGTSEIHLWRGGKMMNLTEGMYVPGETHRPEETLTSIIEGELNVGDKLVFSSAELFYYFSIEKLKRVVEGHSPATAAHKVADQLKEEKDITKTNAIIAEFSMPELIDYDEEDAPEDNWIGKKDSETPLANGALRKALPIMGGFSVREEKADEQEEVVEKTAKTGSDMMQELEIEEDYAAETRPKAKFGLNFARGNQGMDKFSGFMGQVKSAANNPMLKKTGNVLWRYAKYAGLVILALVDLIVSIVSGWVNTIKSRPNGNKILLSAVGILAVVVVVATVSLAKGNNVRVSKKTAVASLESAIQKNDAAKAAIIYEDSAKASSLLFEAYTLAEAAVKNASTKTQALTLLAVIESQLDEVGKVKHLDNLRPLTDFASLAGQIDTQNNTQSKLSLASLIASGSDIYTFDTEFNKIFKYNDSRREAGIVNSLVSKENKIKLGTIIDSNNLVFYASPASVYALNLTENKLQGVALDSGNWNNANGIISYTDKLYFLDDDNNQVWKYKKLTEGYTKIAPYFEDNSNINLKGASKFAIDGSVYILNNNTVTKYDGGVATDFALRNIPEHTGATLGAIKDIFATIATSGLYVLDGEKSRVVMFDTNGNYMKQYVFSGISNPSSMFVDESAGYIWILAGTQVFQLPL
ncbi:hypothetical protein KKE14_00995, partial [Patescibacteria group bacterium]|nr:hypothetical protein [Patescibacteria group bacterium]